MNWCHIKIIYIIIVLVLCCVNNDDKNLLTIYLQLNNIHMLIKLLKFKLFKYLLNIMYNLSYLFINVNKVLILQQ